MRKAQATTAAKKPLKPRQPEVHGPLSDALDSTPEIGFARLNDAELVIADTDEGDDPLFDALETLPELEREIGITDWLDPETGEPAEGQCPPHLDAQ
jgi:hypothetical protein